MKYPTLKQAIATLFLSNFLAVAPVYALTKVRPLSPDTYEKSEIQYLYLSETTSELKCEGSDQVISGGCNLTNQADFPNEIRHGVKLEFDGRVENQHGWKCNVRLLDPRQDVRLTSFVKCKKANS